MKNIVRLLFVALFMMGVTISGKAHVCVSDGTPTKGPDDLKQTTAGCAPSSGYEWLNINNVRTRYNAGGDMWWDLPGGMGAQYYIPANGQATSLFAGALWVAGRDINDQLKCSAVRFRQGPGPSYPGGNDFWTGPLTLKGANIDAVTCAQWDRIWKIERAEVDEFINHLTGPKPDPKSRYGTFEPTEDYEIPKIILEWPAHPEKIGVPSGGDPVSHYMAPFFDNDFDGEYDPMNGDFPYYDIDNELCHKKTPTMDEQYENSIHGSILVDQVLKGDQTLWWVFNDKGNSHTESHGEAIGLEIRAQAFGFSTNDEINNMSFCSYEIINRSSYTLTKTYFCPWTDVDLGYARDDYVGCDVQRGLGYGYNGYSIDGNGEPEAYGNQPPAVGVDFFQGPYMDEDGKDNPKYVFTYNISASGDTLGKIDSVQICDVSINGVNFGNGIVDDERFGMRRFLYHVNGDSETGDPQYASDYYNFLQGLWKSGLPMVYGGNAHPNDANTVGPQCVFMFPGDTDPCNWGTDGVPPGGGYNTNGKYWTDASAGNDPDDRRFMQSAGPFTLKPGAVNYITFGVPWARATSGGPLASVELLRVTDDKCQALFDNCFKVLDGPNAPKLAFRELDQRLIIYLYNTPSSNNYQEGYSEKDDRIQPIPGVVEEPDQYYRFEGYKVYQLVDDQVTSSELDNPAKARLVFQCDVQNGVTNLVNYNLDDHIGANVPTLEVEGGDAGITHSFVITEDQFSTSESTTLVNNKTYYFMAVAYAYNNYLTYAQDPQNPSLLNGQKEPYLEGRKNIECYSAVPHKIVNGTLIQAEYGQKLAITRIVGMGNGGNELELSKENIDELFTKKLANSTYIDEKGDTITRSFGHPDYPVIYHPTYKIGYGPIDVKIIDPLNVKPTSYELWFDTLTQVDFYNVSSNSSVCLKLAPRKYVPGSMASRMASHWYLKDLKDDDEENNTERSDTLNVFNGEQVFLDKGISISINQPWGIGPYAVGWLYDNNPNITDEEQRWYVANEVLAPNSGLITSTFTFQDSVNKWLDGIRDKDIPSSPLNWIRAGKYYDNSNTVLNDYDMTSGMTSYDPNEAFEKIANRTWAPFTVCDCQSNTSAPVPTNAARRPETFAKISSVDIVLTSDTSRWTRCPVVEACPDISLSENEVRQYALRKAASVDKQGRPYIDPETGKPWARWNVSIDSIYMFASNDPDAPNFIAPQGMSWFPGYAIDIETGARLNIIFSEDSYLVDLNGRDMMFNPPTLLKNTVDEVNGEQSQYLDPVIFRQMDQEAVFGGKHYVYILGTGPTQLNSTPQFPVSELITPAYDGGHYAFNLLYRFQIKSSWQTIYRSHLWRQVMYVGMPMPVEGTINEAGFKDNTWIPEGYFAKIRIRVSKPYDRGYSYLDVDSTYLNDSKYDLNYNDLYPMYRFSIEGLDAKPDPDKIVTDLDLINIVPNPYYAFSGYEANALTNKVKITNLPNKCTVTIYNLSGTKIRQFKKDTDEVTSIDWDLTNFANTPVASGFYLIHVKDEASGGERTIKFFGAMRLIDLNTF